MESFLYEKVKPLCHIGIVGGSDFSKIAEQTGGLEMSMKLFYL
jgi:Eukaryotic phosphomannomutase